MWPPASALIVDVGVWHGWTLASLLGWSVVAGVLMGLVLAGIVLSWNEWFR